MSKLYALAGRPANGKTEFLNKLQYSSNQTFRLINAISFASHEDLVKELYNLVQDDSCKCIAIDDYEIQLINCWREQIVDDEYKKCLSILAGFTDSFDVAVIPVVGLKREADKDNDAYYDKSNLRSSAVGEETDEVLFIKQGCLDELSLSTLRQVTGIEFN